jgi:alkylation response protein AidB-like acyl-CoA dehydrogenase
VSPVKRVISAPSNDTVMTFSLSAEHQAVRRAVREFSLNEIQPVAREFDEQKRYPEKLRQKAAQFDFVAPKVPDAYGGAEMDTLSSLIITEELWRVDPGIGLCIEAADFGSDMLLEYGDDWMKDEWLPRLTSGEAVTASGISEPAHGSDVAGIETRAEQDGDDYVINGTKFWITNGTVADLAIVMAKTDSGAGHEGITAFLVPTEVDGFTAEPIDNKLGLHASDTAELILDDVRVPADHILGEENEGFYQLMDFFAPARANVAAEAVGAAQGALDAALDYATERKQFGQSISEYQAIRHKLAEMATTIDAARSLTYRAATAIDEGRSAEATKFASMAKLFASERAFEVVDDAVQVHGGAGYVSDHPVERLLRDVRVTKIYDGTSEIQKNIIADQLL